MALRSSFCRSTSRRSASRPQQIGIVASASLLGTAALTLITGFIAPRFELRNLFLAGAGLIVFTGLVFPAAETIAPVLLVAFIGSINPSGGDLGMLVPLEHALLTKETADRDRTGVFARYSLIGALTSAVGSLAAALPEMLASHGWPRLGAIKLMFYGYAALGLLAALLYRRLPRDHSHAANAPKIRARAVAQHRLPACGVVQPRRLCRRLRRAVAAGAVAVPAIRPVAGSGEPVFLLLEPVRRDFVSGRRLARPAHRPHQHHGVHAHPLQPLPDRRGVFVRA